MPHIALPEGFPGIAGLMAYRPLTAKPLNELAQALLQSPNSLSPAERELIATYVSSQNDCFYCQTIHGAVAAHHLGGNQQLVDAVKQDFLATDLSDKMKALLAIAGKVQLGGRYVTAEDIEQARLADATDQEIHDTVLIAAAFCMYNRYVDGLATWAPQQMAIYQERAKNIAEKGYGQFPNQYSANKPSDEPK
ncbi:peroxidase-related enzyme [Spirosoma sp. SC4-14]|uniref:carboxymuconolactone decarboxylase family protein n=1 Tax=Spirosoma sp. SC4-14 TaxID=3128900 RepID=UPI0030CAE303